MAKKNSKRILIGIVSKITGHRRYTTINKQNRSVKNQGQLTLKKYDPIARRVAEYVETKKNLGRNEVKARKG